MQMDVMGRNIKNQFKLADRLGAKKTIVIGDNELAENKFAVKDILTSEQVEVPMEEIKNVI